MNQVSSRSLIFLTSLLLVFSWVAFLINHIFHHYVGNNYFPQGILLLIWILIFLNWGLVLCFEKRSNFRKIGCELFYLFGVMSLIALATNAVQLTPFPTIDNSIVRFESYFHIHMETILAWANKHARFKELLLIIYNSLPYQMSIIPLFVIVTCRFHLLREYYFFLLSTTLIGFGFYYFFPTTAPASMFNPSFFSAQQIATGIKFSQIHHYLNPTTNEGGLIALPSFHAIWSILCVNLLKEWMIPCVLLLIINLLLIASCILLGWHYCTDIIGAFIVLWISHYFLNFSRSQAPISTTSFRLL